LNCAEAHDRARRAPDSGGLVIRIHVAQDEDVAMSTLFDFDFAPVWLGPDIDPDKVNAAFKNGVLTITVPKRPEAQRHVKRIAIKS
jgi:HSP20 family molecular chaperone IbpA